MRAFFFLASRSRAWRSGRAAGGPQARRQGIPRRLRRAAAAAFGRSAGGGPPCGPRAESASTAAPSASVRLRRPRLRRGKRRREARLLLLLPVQEVLVPARVERRLPAAHLDDLGRELVDEVAVVGDEDQRAAVVVEGVEQHFLGVEVEVVRRLVEEQEVARRSGASWPGPAGSARRPRARRPSCRRRRPRTGSRRGCCGSSAPWSWGSPPTSPRRRCASASRTAAWSWAK